MPSAAPVRANERRNTTMNPIKARSRKPACVDTLMEASQEAGLRAEIAGDRQAALLCLGVPAVEADLLS